MPGPLPTPTAILKQRGSWRAKTRSREPKATPTLPPPPRHLNADERKEYRRVGRQLVGLRVMTAADRDILALFAIAVARVARAEEQIRTSGEVVKSGAGQPIQNPWLTISQKWAMLAERFAQQLGLSPASRTRIQAAPTNDGGDDILDGPLRLAV